MNALVFEPAARSARQIVLRYRVGELRFSTAYWYDTVDFDQLTDRYGEAFMRWMDFHLLAFETNKALSLGPTVVDFGPYTDLVTEPFWNLWETIFHNVWAVWRYENDLPDHRLVPPTEFARRPVEPAGIDPGSVDTLMLVGGGKDSLASISLLEEAGVPYDAFVYSHSTYGRGDHQHELIDGMLAHCRPERHHRGWVFDDAIDSPAARVTGAARRMIAAETVSSYWTALPVALQHGYRNVALGITRSTDEHNLTWHGEDVNYLWGMSSAAERLLHDYLRNHVADVAMFHLLRPIYDVNVFTLLNRRLEAVPSTHSCAQLKPWCGRCAKCLYVWMNYVAWLPQKVVAETIPHNLFDRPENRTILRKMLGLESYKPTDCVGTVGEARLAFLMCRRKGVGGVIADDIDLAPLTADAQATLERYRAVAEPGPTFPAHLAAVVEPQLTAVSAEAALIAQDLLEPR